MGTIFHVGPVLGMLRMTANMRTIEESDRSITVEGTLDAGERGSDRVSSQVRINPLGVPTTGDIDKRIDLGDEAWRAWSDGLRYDGPYREQLVRSALALKLLLYSPSGAIAAAGTTSLPERLGGDKNYDYRYGLDARRCLHARCISETGSDSGGAGSAGLADVSRE